MAHNEIDYEIRSEEVQEILTRVPHWLIRWGSAVLFLILLILLVVSYGVSYPDIISSQIVITSEIPPQKLAANFSGKIEAILVKDGATVAKNTPLAILENAAKFQDVFRLKSITDTLPIDQYTFPFNDFKLSQLGEIEGVYAVFQKELTAYQLHVKWQPFKVEGTAQSNEWRQLTERLRLLELQKSSAQTEVDIQKLDVDRYETLYKKGIISSQEIEKHRLTFLQVERNYKSNLSAISQLKSSLNELKKNAKNTQINENKEAVNLERNVYQAFYGLKKAIKEWELKYVFRSAIDGKLSYLQLWAANQMMNAGDQAFAIIPMIEGKIIGRAKAAAQNAGKIKVGQKVNIRLANYPDREFGIINGVINGISLTPDKDGNLLIHISLPHGLQTSYKKQIAFQQEMSGNADIVTDDLRLLERVLFQFRGVLER
ncbi:MAG: HlyD family secretion protein [Flavobacterium sp. BFFFF2]|nr:MAG: HlyD family secretion protein [Flavobacterium sp. BFFFF2]